MPRHCQGVWGVTHPESPTPGRSSPSAVFQLWAQGRGRKTRSLGSTSRPASPALRLNPFYPFLPTTSVLGVLTHSALGRGAALDPGASGAQSRVPRAARARAWAKCSVGRKGGLGCCHVTLQLCTPRQLELSSTPAPPGALSLSELISERDPHGQFFLGRLAKMGSVLGAGSNSPNLPFWGCRKKHSPV